MDVLHTEINTLERTLNQAEPLPAPIDVLHFKEQIANAQAVNTGLDLLDRRRQKLAEWQLAEDAAKNLTLAMQDRAAAKLAMIAASHMPVPGLGIQDGIVTYNNVPFDQASSAEQLRISVAIAMAANPTLRILRITDGSLLDSKNMAMAVPFWAMFLNNFNCSACRCWSP